MAGKNLKVARLSFELLDIIAWKQIGAIFNNSLWIRVWEFGREQGMTSLKLDFGFRVSGLAWEKLDRLAGVYIVCVI